MRFALFIQSVDLNFLLALCRRCLDVMLNVNMLTALEICCSEFARCCTAGIIVAPAESDMPATAG